jgi:2-oxoglutarate ferredoxin oxidoreductase subunit beta
MSSPIDAPVQLKRKDFVTDQEVRWCPGCGDYAILAQVQKLLPTLGIRKENFVFISGIGCSSRFPYYVDTYGMHTIHGRAPAIATGLKLARPDLSVWMVTGDGDALAIGGNHFIHLMRRNVDLKVLLLNNQIYGLTKGQFSPTSLLGAHTKTTPLGSVDRPFNPVSLAIASGATFVARSVDVELDHLAMVLRAAAEHRGTAFVEVYQNCVTFNDGAYDFITDRSGKEDHRVLLEQGKPLIFGKARDRGIRFVGAAGGDQARADRFSRSRLPRARPAHRGRRPRLPAVGAWSAELPGTARYLPFGTGTDIRGAHRGAIQHRQGAKRRGAAGEAARGGDDLDRCLTGMQCEARHRRRLAGGGFT